MRKRLKLPVSRLLQEVAKKHKIDTGKLFSADGAFVLDDDGVREALLDAITSEFCATGLRRDDEPNERGLKLEELIPLVNDLDGRKTPR